MNDPLQQIGRLAMREHNGYWLAYYATPDTMDGAILLGSIQMAFIAGHKDREAAFMGLMKESVSDLIEEATGTRPAWPQGPQPAPEHERMSK